MLSKFDPIFVLQSHNVRAHMILPRAGFFHVDCVLQSASRADTLIEDDHDDSLTGNHAPSLDLRGRTLCNRAAKVASDE